MGGGDDDGFQEQSAVEEGVPREEAATAAAAESSTGTRTTVWTNLLTDLDYHKGRAYAIEGAPGNGEAFYAFIAYPLDLIEEGSVGNVLISLVGNVFGFKAARALRLEDIRVPLTVVRQRHPGRARRHEQAWPAASRLPNEPKLGLSAKNHRRACCEGLRGGLDVTNDDENVNSKPFMRWSRR